jgi:hypothetical protein
MAAATDQARAKDAPAATAKGERSGVPGKTPAAEKAEAASRSSGTRPRLVRSSKSPHGVAVVGRSGGRMPIGTSMLLTAASATSLAIGWASGEAALIWTSVGSVMGAGMFLALGHHRIAGSGRHRITGSGRGSTSKPESKPLSKPLSRPTPSGGSRHGGPQDGQTS